MKKSLLSLLAVAVAAVGCQNYDDQFDDLNSQIAALSSQVAGLAQVQQDLASLAGTVSSLQSTVASTATAIEGLDGLAETVAEISDAVENVASSEEVSDIASDLDQAQSDLTELLEASSVFTSDVVVNSVATLDVYHKMGSALNVVAGDVTITAKPDMDATKLQELVNNILTTTGAYTYEASQSSVAPVTFDLLTGTQTLTINQPGDYSFKTLGSATVINLKDSYKSKVTKIDFRELTSVQKFQTDGTPNTISFSKAVELHLTKLVYYPPLNLTVVTDEGAAMPFAIDDVDATGDQSDIILDITGPAALTLSNIKDGDITLKDVADAEINGFVGDIIIKEGVEQFDADSVVSLTLTGTLDLEQVNITGAKNPADTKSVGPALNFSSISSLETLDIDGFASSVTAASNGNLTTLTIAGDVAGVIDVNNNTDLTTVTVTGAKATGLKVNTNSDIEALTVDLTYRAGTATGAKLDGLLEVKDNSSLESLIVSSDNIETLTVTGNDDLTTINFDGLTKAGATNTAAVNIYDNDIEGTLVDKDDTASTKTGAGEANDLGKISNDNGMSSLETYITSADATADVMLILFDTVDFTTESDQTRETLWDATKAAADQSTDLMVMNLSANTADTGDADTQAKRSFIIDGSGITVTEIHVNNTALFGSALTLSANQAVAASTAQLLKAEHTALASAANVTFTATPYAGADISVSLAIGPNSSAVENSATAATAAFAFNVSDTFTLSLDGYSVTVTSTAATTATGTFVNSLMAAWEAKYPATASADVVEWTVSSKEGTSSDYGAAFMVMEFNSKKHGSDNIGETLTASHSAGKTATFSNVGILIGNSLTQNKTTADNVARGSDIMVTFEASDKAAGKSNTPIGLVSATQVATGVSFTIGTAVTELNSTYYANSTVSNIAITANAYVNEDRADVTNPEDQNPAASSNASTFSRIGWL